MKEERRLTAEPAIKGKLKYVQSLGGASGYGGAWFLTLMEDEAGQLWLVYGSRDRNVEGETLQVAPFPAEGKDDPQSYMEEHSGEISRTDVSNGFLRTHGVQM